MKKQFSVLFMTLFLVIGIYALVFGLASICITHLLMPLVNYLGLPTLTYKVVAGSLLSIILIIGLVKMFHKDSKK